MDRVYGSALVTIVAASGDDADHGLQGVARKTCQPSEGVERSIDQPSAEVGNAHIIAPFRSQQDLEGTVWNSRGWTFQERLLSRRLLVFAGNEVVWHCRRMTCREDMRNDDSGGTVPPLEWLNLKPKWFDRDQNHSEQHHWVDGSIEVDRFGRTHVVRSGTFTEYAKVVEQYTQRQLTHNSDVIFALEGLLNIFQRSFRSVFLSGLPESLFDIALIWRPTQRLNRRICTNQSKFPSWSWSGWEGPVHYDKPLAIKRDEDGVMTRYARAGSGEEGVRPLVKWYIYNRAISGLEAVNGHGWGIPLASGVLPPEWERSPLETTAQKEPAGPPQIPGRSLSHQDLVFRTSSVNSFQLRNIPSNTRGTIGTNSSDGADGRGKPPLQFLIASPRGVIGRLTLDGADSVVLHQSKHEFILISETHHLEECSDQIGNFADYIVMLVEKNHIRGSYERLGIGVVSKSAWKAADCRVDTFVLS